MSARIHTQASNREKPQQKGKERKPVFKSVLDNPFRIRWPAVPVNMQNLILAQIVSLLEELTVYNREREDGHRKRKRDANPFPRKKRKIDSSEKGGGASNAEKPTAEEDTVLGESSSAIPDPSPPKPVPWIAQHLVVGINAVTKRLEHQIKSARHTVTVSTEPQNSVDPPSLPSIKYLFVCRADVDPPILLDHLPHLVVSFNSCKPSEVIKLVPLPKGAEATLGACLNVRRVAAFGFDDQMKELSALSALLDSDFIPTLAASWLAALPIPAPVIPTHIKQVKTSAPKDLKAAKEESNEGRANAKKRKREEKGKGNISAASIA